MSKFEPNWIITIQMSYLSEATVANFQNNGGGVSSWSND